MPPIRTFGVFQFLKNAAGNPNAVGDYSGAPETLFIEADTAQGGTDMIITRMIVSIEFSRELKNDGYGPLGNPLTNGIKIRLFKPQPPNQGVVLDLLDGTTLNRHSDYARFCYDIKEEQKAVRARWTFSFAKGLQPDINKPTSPLVLPKGGGVRLEVVLNDNFSDLKGHFFQVQGEVD